MTNEEAAALRASDIERLKAEIAAGDAAAGNFQVSSSEQKTNPKQTPEEQAESLQWLRDRGIEVETPEDRSRAREIAASMSKLSAKDVDTSTFTYVHIPADPNVPMSEKTAVVYSDNRGNGDQLLTLLKPCFSSGTVDGDALRRVAESTHLGNESSGDVLKKVTPASIASGGGAVETFRLADGVSLYLDAVGALKSAPANPRGAQLASQCGYGDVPLFGDLYVGRRSQVRNESFKLVEMSSNCQWLKEAASENMARQQVESQFRGGGMTADELNERGGEGDGYMWKQTTEEVEVNVPLPDGTRGKQCKVKFGNRSLNIDVITGNIALSFPKLYGMIHADDSLWTVQDNVLVVTMEKAKNKQVWPTLDA
jgi:hypothetical protein